MKKNQHDQAETAEATGAATADREAVAEAEAAAEASGTVESGAGEGEKPDGAASAETGEAPRDEELQTRFMRLAADFQNFRRRVDKEKSEVFAFANEKIMTEMLPVIDNFDRALIHGTADTGYADGMSLIYKQLLEALRKNGLSEVKAEGEVFDPDFHHAVMMEQKEGIASGNVTEVLQKGYLLNNKVIRPAMVKVAE